MERMDRQVLAMLEQMEAQVAGLDVSCNPTVVFLQALQAELLLLGVEASEVTTILEHMDTDINTGSDEESQAKMKLFAQKFAKVVKAALTNASIQALDPVFRRTILKGLKFNYQG